MRQPKPTEQLAERGAATVWVLMVVAIALAGASLLYDLGLAAVARSNAADAATSLARAGATEVDNGSSPFVNTDEARDVIEVMANERWPDLDWDVIFTAEQVIVTVSGTYDARLAGPALGWTGTDYQVSSAAGVQQ